jgi:hypothetical protein
VLEHNRPGRASSFESGNVEESPSAAGTPKHGHTNQTKPSLLLFPVISIGFQIQVSAKI